MSFDPITYGAVVGGQDPVGTPKLVPTGFTSTSYVDAGKTFNPETYPALATMFPVESNPAAGLTEITLPAVPMGYSSSTTAIGTVVCGFDYLDTLYIITTVGAVFKSNGLDTSTMTYVRMLPTAFVNLPTGTSTNTAYTPTFSVANNRVFVNGNVNQNLTIMDCSAIVDPLNTTFTTVVLTGVNCVQVVYGNNVYVALRKSLYLAGVAGTSIWSSPDGITWTMRTMPTVSTNIPYGLAFGNGVFVATTNGLTTGNVATSTDGITWVARSGGTVGHRATAFIPSSGLFLSTSATTGAAYMTSPDGITWTVRSASSLTPVNDIVSAGAFVMAYTAGNHILTPAIWTNTDTTTWSIYSQFGQEALYACSYSMKAIVFKDSILMFGGTWSSITSPVSSVAHVVYGQNGYFVYTSRTAPATIGYLPPVASGTYFRAPVFIDANIGIAIEGTPYTPATGYGGALGYTTRTLNAIKTIDGGATWAPIVIAIGMFATVMDIYASAGRFFVMCGGANSQLSSYVATSTDGDTWSIKTGPSTVGPFVTVDSNGNLYSSAGITGVTTSKVSKSSDFGTTWAASAVIGNPGGTITAPLQAIALKSGALVIDGVTSGKPAYIMFDDAVATGKLQGITYPGSATTSMTVTAAAAAPFLVAYDSTRSVAMTAGDSNAYITTDGSSWVAVPLPQPAGPAASVFMMAGWIVIIIGGATIMYSKDGKSWIVETLATVNRFTNKLVAGTNGVKAFYIFPSTIGTTGKMLVSSTVNTVPPMTSSVAGAKWVVKAK
jgi:hypothetical protein